MNASDLKVFAVNFPHTAKRIEDEIEKLHKEIDELKAEKKRLQKLLYQSIPVCTSFVPGETKSIPRVELAAILGEDNIIYSVPRPGRHHDVIRLMTEQGKNPKAGEQGFLLSDNTFANREVAKIIAKEAGQLLPREMGHNRLYSEDVW